MLEDERPIPQTENEWLDEIAEAYEEARETIPVGQLVGKEITEEDLFHLGPAVCMMYRGFKQTEENKEKAVETALQSYLATKDQEEVLDDPVMGFAFCYIVAHWGLELIDEAQCRALLVLAEENLEEIQQRIEL